MHVTERKLLATTAVGLCLAASCVSGASAQVQAKGGVAELDEVVVTGSHLKTTEFNSPSPVQVITAEDVKARGVVDTGEILQKASVAAGAFQQNATLFQYGANGIAGGSGSSSVSLRGLGAIRTLVLLNGRRVSSSGFGGNVAQTDLTVLPSSIIERVDILKDGASSVYGSDAVAGVVNIITKSRMEGGELNLYINAPQRAGGEVYEGSIQYGRTFDRGHLLGVLSYNRQAILNTEDRRYTSCFNDYISNPTTGDRVDVIDSRTGAPKCLGNFYGGAQVSSVGPGYLQFDPTNVAGPYGAYAANPYFAQGWRRVNIPGNPASYQPGNTDPYLPGSDNDFAETALLASERTSLFVSGGYDLTSSVEAFGELLMNRRTTRADAVLLYSPTISGLHASNPFGQTALPSLNLKNPNRAEIDFAQVLVGARGDYGIGWLKGWTWEAWGQYARSDATYTVPSLVKDAVTYSDGNPANGECGVNGVTQTPISQRACTPVNWFAPGLMQVIGHFSPAEEAFLRINATGKTRYTQKIVEASTAGDLFSLPAGKVSAAFGAQWRRNSLTDTPDLQSRLANLVTRSEKPTQGSQTVREYFGELGVPILRDVFLAKEVTLSLSGRITDQDPSGAHSTYKVGLNWAIFPELRLRGTYGTSFRAPAVFEQVLGSSTLFYTQTQYPGFDPCINRASARIATNCTADGVPAGYSGTSPVSGQTVFATVTTGGNADLKPEESKAYTLGVVWQAPFADLQVAVDYWNIELKNGIATLSGREMTLCYEAADFPTNPFCSLFTRDKNPASPTYLQILTVQDNYQNIAGETRDGVDLTIRYSRDIWWDTKFSLNTQLSWILENTRTSRPGALPVNNNSSVFSPGFGGQIGTRFERGPWALAWNVQLVGHGSNIRSSGSELGTSSRATGQVKFKRYVEATTYHDVSLRRSFETMQVQAGVQNLFDEAPPAISSDFTYRRGESALPAWDLLGRRFYLRVAKSF